MTLLVGLVMLFVLTVMAVASFRLGVFQTVVISNAQQQIKGVAAADQAIETVINSSNFTVNPNAAITVSNCASGGTNVLCTSSNGGTTGKQDFKVTVAVTCVSANAIPTSDLDVTKDNDLACISGSQQGTVGISGSAGSSGANSLCASSLWNIDATATSPDDTNAVNVSQGVSQRILIAEKTTFCP